jgi:hypothetical protein
VPGFILAETILALGSACCSGVLASWARNYCDEKISHRAVSIAMGLGGIASIPTALLGSYVGEWFGLEKPWLLTGLSLTVSAAIVFWLIRDLPDSARSVSLNRFGRELLSQAYTSLKETIEGIRQSFRASWKSEQLRFSIVVAFISAAAFQPINTFWSPVLKDAGGSFDWLRLMWVFIALAGSLGSVLAMGRWTSISSRGLALVLLISGVPLFLALKPQPWLILVGIAVHEVGRGMLRPLLFSYSNLTITGTYRATFNSVRTSLWTLGAASGLMLPALLSLWFSVQVIWGISAMALTLLSFYAWKKNSH